MLEVHFSKKYAKNRFFLIFYLSYDIMIEMIEEYAKEYNQLEKLDSEIGKTESAIAHEMQFKKRFEYCARLKEYRIKRKGLITFRGSEGVTMKSKSYKYCVWIIIAIVFVVSAVLCFKGGEFPDPIDSVLLSIGTGLGACVKRTFPI